MGQPPQQRAHLIGVQTTAKVQQNIDPGPDGGAQLPDPAHRKFKQPGIDPPPYGVADHGLRVHQPERIELEPTRARLDRPLPGLCKILRGFATHPPSIA